MTKIICIAGFGDDASMFAPLIEASRSSALQLYPVDLPGFGAPALHQQTSLGTLAMHLAARAKDFGAHIVLAHSVASIIASLAVQQPGSPLKQILSLEGNLTPEDAYFSGSAAAYESAAAFRTAFLKRLDDMAKDDPIIVRYRASVEHADPKALWELGCDAHRFSNTNMPGGFLQSAPQAAYLFNPDNLPESSRIWLQSSTLPRFELPGASHWASVDQPQMLLDAIIETIGE